MGLDEEEEKKYGTIPEEGEFVVYGEVYADPLHADALAELYTKMTQIARTQEVGKILYYCIARNTANPTTFHFFEHYKNKAAFEEHVAREETTELLKSGWIRDVKARFERPLGS